MKFKEILKEIASYKIYLDESRLLSMLFEYSCQVSEISGIDPALDPSLMQKVALEKLVGIRDCARKLYFEGNIKTIKIDLNKFQDTSRMIFNYFNCQNNSGDSRLTSKLY